MLSKIYQPKDGDDEDRVIVIGLTHEELSTLKETDQAMTLGDAGIHVVIYSEETNEELESTFLKLIGAKGSEE